MTHRIEPFGALLLAALLGARLVAAPATPAASGATASSTEPAPMTSPPGASEPVSLAATPPAIVEAGPPVKLELGTCADCHDVQAAALPLSIHGKAGITCVGCHGGDATSDDQEQAMSPARGFLGKVGRRDVPPFCARCHSDPKRMAGTGLPTDQFSHYRASFHGKKVLGEGDTTAAVCTDCHGSHEVLSVKDPRSPAHRVNIPATCDKCHGDDVKMNVYAIPTDQYKKWRTSFHGRAVLEKKDLTAAVCTDCHGKHDIVNPQDTRSRVHPVNIVTTCGRCHGDAKLMEKHALPSSIPREYAEGVHGVALLKHGMTAAPNCTSCHGNHGALPPAVKNVAMVCGRCHTRSEEYYLKSPHAAVKAFKGCIECHGNHRIARPGPYLFAVACHRCHAEGSPESELAKKLATEFEKASFSLEAAARSLEKARGFGYSLEKLEAVLQEGKQAKVEVVPALHSLDRREGERFLAKAEEVEKSIRDGVESIRTRILLRNVSLGMVLLLILGAVLVFKLKLDRLTAEEDEPSSAPLEPPQPPTSA